jgi:hypothetical protein
MYGTFERENRESPYLPVHVVSGRAAQRTLGGTAEMYGYGQSDGPVVPAIPPNKASAAEVGGGKGAGQGEHRP